MAALLVASTAPLPRSPAAPPLYGQTSITIYNDGRVLVRRSVQAKVPQGQSTQRLVLGPLDPGTIFSLDSLVLLQRVIYDGAVDEASALRRSIGKRLVFRLPESNDTISALVLGVDPLRLQLPDGRISFTAPGLALYPPDVVVAEPSAVLGVRSPRAQDQLRLGYFTTGASWKASYQVILDPKDARVSGMAVLTSESLRADNAEVHLLAGAVGRAEAPPQPPRPLMREELRAAAQTAMSDVAVEQRVGEFHLYSLSGRSTLLPGQTTSQALFEPAEVRYEHNYIVHGDVPYWGFLPQQGEQVDLPVEITYTIKRPRKTSFGDQPLPGGVARVYQTDTTGALQLVGEAAMEHTAPGRDLTLKAGNAFDLTARRVQTSYSTRRDSTKARGVHTVATADYRVTLTNATDTAAMIDVQEERAGEWSVVSSSVPPEKISSTITRFRVRVPARGEAVLSYRIRVIW
ncbi:MAG TPA: hypothetical protein VHH32_13105 [Gemmatimonadales bacterium]|nr:hypothetical protein [Gemmatimonadales bacterium]